VRGAALAFGTTISVAAVHEDAALARAAVGEALARARRVDGGYRITGRKVFSSGSPVGDLFMTMAVHDDPESGPTVVHVAIPFKAEGVAVQDNWRTLGMRGTGSHDVVLDGVFVPDAAVGVRRPAGRWSPVWHVVATMALPLVYAVYVGIAEAARDFAIQFAQQRTPTALGGKSIASLPHIRERAGRMDLLLYEARAILLGTARAWDAAPSSSIEAALAAAKVVTTNNAVAVAEAAMRLVGGSSLHRDAPLERHFRDVRGGLHHPPQDDAALALFAREALD
jgi:acyl-CoA dehydrogenase